MIQNPLFWTCFVKMKWLILYCRFLFFFCMVFKASPSRPGDKNLLASDFALPKSVRNRWGRKGGKGEEEQEEPAASAADPEGGIRERRSEEQKVTCCRRVKPVREEVRKRRRAGGDMPRRWLIQQRSGVLRTGKWRWGGSVHGLPKRSSEQRWHNGRDASEKPRREGVRGD